MEYVGDSEEWDAYLKEYVTQKCETQIALDVMLQAIALANAVVERKSGMLFESGPLLTVAMQAVLWEQSIREGRQA